MRPSDENAVPRRSILEKLLVKKWEYSFPPFFLGLRLAIGVILVAVGILLLPHTYLGLLPLAFAALAFVFGPTYTTRSPRAGRQLHRGLRNPIGPVTGLLACLPSRIVAGPATVGGVADEDTFAWWCAESGDGLVDGGGLGLRRSGSLLVRASISVRGGAGRGRLW